VGNIHLNSVTTFEKITLNTPMQLKFKRTVFWMQMRVKFIVASEKRAAFNFRDKH